MGLGFRVWALGVSVASVAVGKKIVKHFGFRVSGFDDLAMRATKNVMEL